MPSDGVKLTVDFEGNFFRRDPGKTFRANVRDMLDDLAEWMEAEVESQVRGHASAMPAWTGWSADHVLGRTTSVSGRRWGTWARVSSFTGGLERTDAIRTKAAAATIERRWHPFRQVKSAIYRARPLITANLTEGLE